MHHKEIKLFKENNFFVHVITKNLQKSNYFYFIQIKDMKYVKLKKQAAILFKRFFFYLPLLCICISIYLPACICMHGYLSLYSQKQKILFHYMQFLKNIDCLLLFNAQIATGWYKWYYWTGS